MVVMSLGGWPLSWLIIIWVWGLGLMVAQAAEVLVVYRRAFVFAVLVELTSVLFLLGSIAGLRPITSAMPLNDPIRST